MRLTLLLFAAITCFGANYCVGVTPAGITCTGSVFLDSDVQNALDSVSASGGDTVYLHAGHQYPELQFRVHGSAVTHNVVTSSSYQFLPCVNCRISLSYRGLLPILHSTSINVPSMSGNLDSANTVNPGSGQPPKGWTFIGIQFDTALPGAGIAGNASFTNGGRATGPFSITGPTLLPDSITIDRCLFFQPYGETTHDSNVIWVNGTNVVIKNTYIVAPFYPDSEGHTIYCDTCPGPQTLINNAIGTSVIPVFNGGTEPEYNPFDGSVGLHDSLQRYNYTFRPLKWWSNPSTNPHYDWFVANGSKVQTVKNLSEYKSITNGTVELGVFDGQWKDNYVGGQWYGVTAVFRQTAYNMPANMGNLNLTNGTNSFTWDGTYTGMTAGMALCLSYETPPASQQFYYECHLITVVNTGVMPRTATIAGVWATAQANPQTSWALVTDPTSTSQNLTYQNNVFRRAAAALNLTAHDRYIYPVSENPSHPQFGRMNNFTYRNNLVDNSTWAPNLDFDRSLIPSPQEVSSYSATCDTAAGGFSGNLGGQNVAVAHNTFRVGSNVAGGSAFQYMNFNGDGPCTDPILNFSLDNNVFSWSSDPLYGTAMYWYGPYGARTWIPGPPYYFGMVDNIATGTASASGNYFPVISDVSSSRCVFTTCTANDGTAANPLYLPNGSKSLPSSLTWKTATDGTDKGVNEGLLPQMKNLRVTVSDHTALLEADLSGPIADAAGNQPCTLEVSSATVTAHAYTVTCQDSQVCDPAPGTNDLNPAYFKNAPASNRTNPLLLYPVVANGHLSFPIGANATVTGDDGNPHDLRLSASTLAAGTLACYGDSQTFEFTTAASTSGASSVPMQFHPPAGVATVRVDYGATSALGANVTASVSGGVASLGIPVTAGAHLYFQVTYKDGGGSTIYTGPIQVQLP